MSEHVKQQAPAGAAAGSRQPRMHGYNAEDVKTWSPENDKDAKYFRSRVPLAKRIAPFVPTQAKPSLSAEPQVMNLSADYSKERKSYRYADAFCRNLHKFWQYTDLYGSWHGLPVPDSPEDDPVYGVINLPNPAYTDAAHRNGVLSLGCWFWPRDVEFADWVERKPDGTFPIADKLIEMAAYFGFDGYFINQEARVAPEHAAKLMDMIKYMRMKARAPFHLQWYDAVLPDGSLNYQNQFNDKNAPWITDNGQPVNSSMFVNYAWSDTRLLSSNEYAKSIGLDPLQVLFAGTENDKYGYNPPYDPQWIIPEGEPPRTGWALFGTDFVWNRYANKHDPMDQEAVFRRERRYWSGQHENPAKTVRTLYHWYPDPYHAVNPEEYRCWDGVAHYIPERSVIGSYPFVTRFNTGHGKSFFLNGEAAGMREWSNAGIQDILPSWQWWATSFGPEDPLTASFDYDTAYDGGSSLKVTGVLGPANPTELRLFKTKLLAAADVTLTVTYRMDRMEAPGTIQVGLMFEDNPETFVWLDVCGRTNVIWRTASFDLGKFAGRTIATIGMRFESETQTDFTIHIGQLSLTNACSGVPAAPTGLAVEEAFIEADKAELFVSWDLCQTGVWYYDLYRMKPDGKREAVGRMLDDVYYVKLLERAGHERSTTLELVAVGYDGTASEPATVELQWPEPVKA
ncbi:endo-beta-N-acetylglucosaminidase [Paenibacillus sp. MBLB4367]|uniref:endo-beta-N-acetylglucosaminidase n=1 Tax=Paenibacillus sp. MBLB4367 TaxID=3384767 RepID=UPI003907FE14